MPIPELNPQGLLPSGIHDCTIEDIGAAFSSNNPTDRRAYLFNKLRAFIAWIRPMGHFSHIYVDGSFVTNKQIPGDIDVVLELPTSTPNLGSLLLRSRVFDRTYVYGRFDLHVFPYVENSSFNDLRAFFQYLRPEETLSRGLLPGQRKGILRLAL